MNRYILFSLAFLAILAAANAQYNQTRLIPSPEAGGTPTTAILNPSGISAVIIREKGTKRVLIADVVPEGAAAKAGLLARDYIVKIDDQQIDGMDLNAVAAMLRGDPGTKVTVTIVRAPASAPSDFIVTRELIRLKEVPSK